VQKINQITTNLRKAEKVSQGRLEQKILDEITGHFFAGTALAAKH
jgi:hypothetical protein